MDERIAGSLGRFLTLADAAEILNISVAQAYALVRSGELPAIKLGGGADNSTGKPGKGKGHWRIERVLLESFIEAKYEETRRMNLWYQSDFSDLPELTIERKRD